LSKLLDDVDASDETFSIIRTGIEDDRTASVESFDALASERVRRQAGFAETPSLDAAKRTPVHPPLYDAEPRNRQKIDGADGATSYTQTSNSHPTKRPRHPRTEPR